MTGRLGIVAGGGRLPGHLVEVCRESGRDIFVVAFEGHTDPDTVEGVEHCWTRLGSVSNALSALRRAGVEELVLAGSIERPSLASLRPDRRAAQFFAKVGLRAVGDDGLLRAVIRGLEEEGFRVLGVDDILERLVARAGRYGGPAPDQQALSDIRRGIAVGQALGAQDVGQAVVVQQGIVLGVEAVEGTDALLARCAHLRREGPGGVLVKVKKPGQERRADLPTIGMKTLRGAAAAGLRGVAVEAGGALVIDPDAIGQGADEAGLFVIGVEIPS